MADPALLFQAGGSGSLGITLSKGEPDERGIVAGDTAVLLPSDEPETITLHVPPGE